jgi:hypothetical protein
MSSTTLGCPKERRGTGNVATSGSYAEYTFSHRSPAQLVALLAVLIRLGLAFQVGHFFEHGIQFAVCISGKFRRVAANFCGRDMA